MALSDNAWHIISTCKIITTITITINDNVNEGHNHQAHASAFVVPCAQEKGHQDCRHDVDDTRLIAVAGSSFICDFEKEGGFIGVERALAQKALAKESGGMSCRANSLVQLREKDPLLSCHDEVI
jgi:hypothetical protein